MFKSYQLIFMVCALSISLLPAQADVVWPATISAQKRFQNNPSLFDETDQYCENKKLSAACEISGTVFEGGGKGKCERKLNHLKIALVCNRKELVKIDRMLPSTFSETRPFPLVKDQFCAKLKVGAKCSVTLLHNGKPEHYTGICKQNLEGQPGVQRRPSKVREVISCEPIKPTPERVYKPVSTVKKLLNF
jgi:hypothetical protein